MESVTDATGAASTRARPPFGRDSVVISPAPQRVVTELAELDRAFAAAVAAPHGTDAENAERAARLALVCARRAGWWGLLARWAYQDQGVPRALAKAVVVARQADREDARFWRETAADWRARAGRRPTSDAAGALSNRHELGVGA